MNALHYFKDKICTIITGPINRDFNEETLQQHFVVRILEISPIGIVGMHPKENLYNFFNMANVVMIQEELVLNPNKPEDKKKLEQIEKAQVKEKELDEVPSSSQFVSLGNLKKIVRDIKTTQQGLPIFHK